VDHLVITIQETADARVLNDPEEEYAKPGKIIATTKAADRMMIFTLENITTTDVTEINLRTNETIHHGIMATDPFILVLVFHKTKDTAREFMSGKKIDWDEARDSGHGTD
jgi:hypothetical protein